MNHRTPNRQRTPMPGSKSRNAEKSDQKIVSESLIHRPQSFLDDFRLEHSDQPAALRNGIALAARVESWASTRVNATSKSAPSCLYLG